MDNNAPTDDSKSDPISSEQTADSPEADDVPNGNNPINNNQPAEIEEEWKEQDDRLKLSDDEAGTPEPQEATLLVNESKLTSGASVIDLLMGSDPDPNADGATETEEP